MSLNRRKDDDILNDLDSAQGRFNSSKIIDLKTELETNEMKEKIHRANIEYETTKIDKEQNQKIKELRKSLDQDPNLMYFNNKILDELWEINKDNISRKEVKLILLKYFQIDEKDVNINNIEIIYDDKRKGITIKTKSIYEQLLLGERVKTKQKNIIENKDLIYFAEEKSLEILNNPEQKKELEDILRIQGKEKAKEEIQNRVIMTWWKKISTNEKELLNTILINTWWWIKYSTTEKINWFKMEYPVKIGDMYVITMLDSKLSNILPTFDGKEWKEVYQDILNHEYQHQETMTYKNGLLTWKIQWNSQEIPDPKNELECHLFYVKDEIISHLWNQLNQDRSIDFNAIERNLTRKTVGVYGYPWPFQRSAELMKTFTTKIKEYLQYVKENYLKTSIKEGKHYPSKEAISDMMKKLYEQWPNVKIE